MYIIMMGDYYVPIYYKILQIMCTTLQTPHTIDIFPPNHNRSGAEMGQ